MPKFIINVTEKQLQTLVAMLCAGTELPPDEIDSQNLLRGKTVEQFIQDTFSSSVDLLRKSLHDRIHQYSEKAKEIVHILMRRN